MTWYNTGTLKTTANSAIVVGTNTAWITSGLRPGDMLLIGYNTVSPRPFEIKSIDSATQITLVIAFPVAVTAAAYVGIPMLSGDRTAITMTLAQQVTKAFADNQAMQAVWQTFYSGSGTVTLTMPDGSKVTGSSFLKLTADMAGKASLVSGAVPISQGGTGATTYQQALTNLGAYPASGGTVGGTVSINGTLIIISNDSGFNSISFRHSGSLDKVMSQMFTENYGDLVFQTSTATNQPLYYFSMRQNGNFTVPGNISCASLTQTSDATKKKLVEPIENALSKINKIDGVTFLWKENDMPSAGIIAQQLMEVLPESVSSVFDDHNEYGDIEVEEINQETGEKTSTKERKLIKARDDSKRSYSVEYSGVVALCVEAIKELSEKVRVLEAQSDTSKGEPTS